MVLMEFRKSTMEFNKNWKANLFLKIIKYISLENFILGFIL